MRRIALTGGIGSGKSAAAALLAERGAVVIDADALAREVVAPGTAGLAAVRQAFPGVVVDGVLDRAALARIVFGDASARRTLESITHPLIGELTATRMAAAPADAIVVYDVPLLAESGKRDGYDLVVVVETPLDVRLARLAVRGLPEPEARRRIAAQASDETRRALADIVLDNAGDLAALAGQVAAAWPAIAGIEIVGGLP